MSQPEDESQKERSLPRGRASELTAGTVSYEPVLPFTVTLSFTANVQTTATPRSRIALACKRCKRRKQRVGPVLHFVAFLLKSTRSLIFYFYSATAHVRAVMAAIEQDKHAHTNGQSVPSIPGAKLC